MRISFWLTSTTRELGEENWGKTPMGGAEVSAVQLGEELLKLGHEVSYYLQRAKPFERGRLRVRTHDQVFDEEHDYFICVRPHLVLDGDFGKVKKILWSGDAFDQSSNDIFWNRDTARSLDAFVFKSNWQKEKVLEKYFYIEPEKTRVIYNGVKTDNYNGDIEHQKNRFIYASTWYRGVFNFIEIWPKILEKIPEAEIHVFAKTSLYSEMNPKDDGWIPIAEELCKLRGMVLREPVPQEILTEEIQKSWLMLYPNTRFVESSCGVALQSLVAGTPVITTKRAGLPETVGKGGILIEEKDGWEDTFAEKVYELWWKKEKWKPLSEWGKSLNPQVSWTQKAKEWETFLRSL